MMQDFGSVTTGGTSSPVTITVSNTGDEPTGPLMVMLSGANPNAFGLQGTTCTSALGPGSSCQVTLVFTPATTGALTASLDVSATPGGSRSVALSGQGAFAAALSIAPMTHDFRGVGLGSSSTPQAFTITNTGGSPTGVPNVAVTGADGAMFTISGNTCTTAIAPAGTCTVTIVFVPTATGARTATLAVSATPGGMASATLNATGQTPAALSAMPSPGIFNDTVSGGTGNALTFTLTNTGQTTTPALAVAIGGTNPGDFVRGMDTCSGQMVAGAGTCAVTVEFRPSATGARTALLTVSATGVIPASVVLSGVGLAPALLQFTGSTLSFGSVATGASGTASITVSNVGQVPSGLPGFSATPSPEFAFSGSTCLASIPPGGSCLVTFRFSPAATGARTGMGSASASPGGMASVTLQGTGVTPGALAIAPSSRDFGSVVVNQAGGFQDFTVTNTGGTVLTGLSIALGGSAASSFSISNNTCGTSLGAMATCGLRVSFTPQAAGALSAFLTATSGSNTAQASLSGVGLAPASLRLTPASHTFPSTVIGQTDSQVFTVQNTGDVSSGTVTVATGGTHATQFLIQSSTCTSTLAPLASCSFRIVYTPTTAGNHSGTVTASASPGGMSGATLTGSAITPAQLTLVPASGSSANYGDVLLNTTRTMSFTVTNTGQQTSGSLTLALSGTNSAQWAVGTGAGSCLLGQPLAGGASCTSPVRFTAFTANGNGMKTATLTASASPGSSPTQALSANVQNPAQLSVTQTSHDFGGGEVGVDSAPLTWTIQNVGDVPTGTLSLVNSNTADFNASGCAGTLAPGASCNVSVVFSPDAGGTRNGTITVSGTPGGSVALSATGRGQWRLTIVASFSGGTVSTTDNLLMNCGSSGCSRLYDNGSAVTVRANSTNGSGSRFVYWVAPTGTCTSYGNGHLCTVTMTGHTTANARFLPISHNLIFVSSQAFAATLGSATAYDTQCNTLATTAGINNAAGNNFVAWMSTDSNTPTSASRLGTGKGAFYRMDNTLFALSETDLLAHRVLSAPNLDEYGRYTNAAVWTGTFGDGTANAPNDCTNWTSTSGSAERGISSGGPSRWSVAFAGYSCANTARIYCLSKASTTAVAMPTVPSGGKVAYVTSNTFTPSTQGSGFLSLDTFCNNNKPTGFTTRNFLAFAASTAITAASRVDAAATYYRTDGMRIGVGADFVGVPPTGVGIWRATDGSYVVGETYVWTGASSPTSLATTATNCFNFTSSGVDGYFGRVPSVISEYFAIGLGGCSVGRRLYCVEQ